MCEKCYKSSLIFSRIGYTEINKKLYKNKLEKYFSMTFFTSIYGKSKEFKFFLMSFSRHLQKIMSLTNCKLEEKIYI